MTWWVLFSGIVGALLVFILGTAREEWRNDREKPGLLRLLLAEIDHNIEVFETIGETKRQKIDVVISPEFAPSVRVDTWQDVRAKAARLLNKQLRDALNAYYSPLQTLLTLVTFKDKLGNDHMNRVARQMRNPYLEYFDRTIAAQEEVRDLIEEYLELPGRRRVPLIAQEVVGFGRRNIT
jgi:hypothetical protein